MAVTRHISLDDEHFEKMRTYIEKNNGNFGSALREIINKVEKKGSFVNSSFIDNSLFKWMLTEIDGRLIPGNVLDQMIKPWLICSMSKLEGYLKGRLSELEWDVDINLKFDRDILPSDVIMEMGGDAQKTRFVAQVLSQYLIKNSLENAPLEIKYVIRIDDIIKLELVRSDKTGAQRSLIAFFGGTDRALEVIKSKPDFWNSLIKRHLLNEYNMVTLHRNCLEELLIDKIPTGEVMIETLAKRPIQEIPFNEILYFIKEIYETSRIVDKVEIDNDTLIVSHNFRNRTAIEKLKKCLTLLLETNGHLYDAKQIANMIILTHRPDVGIKINEIVDNMKNSDSRVDQELIMFIAFLKGLKDIPDIPISLTALGRRIGKSLMQEYESENNIKYWTLETFQKALESIDSKLHRESEWKLEGRNLLYTIKKCGIAREGNIFDSYVCNTARETFKGAMSYAFGKKSILIINKLLTHGDDICQVIIKTI